MSSPQVNGRLSTDSTTQERAAGARALVGVDENGLGPLLGPLVVTAVLARATPRGERLASRKLRGALAARVGDSKALVGYGHAALGEAWARALARLEGPDPASPEELFRRLSLDPHEVLTAPCPAQHRDLCFRDGDAFTSEAEHVTQCTRDLGALARRGLELASVRVIALCNRKLNDAAARGTSRFTVDLHAMERHVLDARARAGEPVYAVCGKVGGYDYYGPHFGPLAGRLHVTLAEGRAESRYRFPDLGEVAFVQDADATHVLVGLASLVGKWARDRLTAQVLRALRASAPELPDASGYHDPVTKRLVESSKAVRAALGIEDRCFLRDVAKAAPKRR
jgi:ribonuclease HII